MKTQFFLFAITCFSVMQLFAQAIKTMPLQEKTLAPTPNAQNMKIVVEQKKQNVPPPAPPANLQSASINILNGDDGKDNDTYVLIDFLDNNQRAAANYNNAPHTNGALPARPNDEYFSGSSVTLPMKTEASIPTGQMTQIGALPLPVLRYATPGDFANGGEVKITINPNGHDTWKIQTLSITISFDNDKHSPHRITWSNIVLSQDSRVRELLFDKNFNPL
jgi:hypothetical protein